MAAALTATVFAIVLGHLLPAMAVIRDHDWFRLWLARLAERPGIAASPAGILVSIGVPVLGVALMQHALADVAGGFVAFVFGLLVLYYCWGPRDLDRDVESVLEAPSGHIDHTAARVLPVSLADARRPRALVGAVFRAALSRWFAVLFWFLLLGPMGAALYRLTRVGAQQGRPERRVTGDTAPASLPEPDADMPVAHVETYRRLEVILDWPAAMLVAATLAVVAHFDAVVAAWRDWNSANGGPFALATGFLEAAGVAAVRTDMEELGADAFLVDGEPAPPALAALGDAMALVWRVLVAWLALLALFVIAGFVA